MNENLMEIFSEIACFVVIGIVGYSIPRILYKIKKIETLSKRNFSDNLEILKSILENQEKLEEKFTSLSNDLDREILVLLQQLESIKPIKPNNWDNVRAAFTPPKPRVDVNE